MRFKSDENRETDYKLNLEMANVVLENIEDQIEILSLRIEKLRKAFDKLDLLVIFILIFSHLSYS